MSTTGSASANDLLLAGLRFQKAGDMASARQLYRRVLALAPRHPDALHLSGLIEMQQGNFLEARSLIRKAIRVAPGNAAFHGNLGTVLLTMGDSKGAVAAYQQSVTLDPHYVDGWRNLGSLGARIGDHQASALAYSTVVRLTGGQDGEALGYLGLELAVLCEWENLDLVREALAALPVPAGDGAPAPPFSLLVHDFTPAELRRFADRAAGHVRRQALAPGTVPAPHRPAPRPDRLRIGYLSEDFHEHATAYLLAEALEGHDRGRFEIVAYSYGPDDRGPMRGRLRAACERWVELGHVPPAASAERIRAEGVDILVDLKGHTGLARTAILALRPAPIQVAWLGFPGTFGGDCMDYIIADPFVIPPGGESDYAEQVVRLPHAYQPNDSRRPRPARRPDKAALGLPADALVACVFNNSFKITPEMFRVWMDLLRVHPKAVLWFVEFHPAATATLRRMAGAAGIDPTRLVFAPRVPQAEHLARMAAADLFLDTYPCGGHTTASDALWTGLPVVALAGATFASRVAGSLLHALGLDELIAGDLDTYEAVAGRLLGDPAVLEATRARVAAATAGSPVFDGRHFVRHLEDAFDRMWERWQRGEHAQGFTVECR